MGPRTTLALARATTARSGPVSRCGRRMSAEHESALRRAGPPRPRPPRPSGAWEHLDSDARPEGRRVMASRRLFGYPTGYGGYRDGRVRPSAGREVRRSRPIGRPHRGPAAGAGHRPRAASASRPHPRRCSRAASRRRSGAIWPMPSGYFRGAIARTAATRRRGTAWESCSSARATEPGRRRAPDGPAPCSPPHVEAHRNLGVTLDRLGRRERGRRRTTGPSSRSTTDAHPGRDEVRRRLARARLGPHRRMSRPPSAGAGCTLGQMLVQDGILTDEQVATALERQRKSKERLGQVLIEMRLIDEEVLLKYLGAQFRKEPITRQELGRARPRRGEADPRGSRAPAPRDRRRAQRAPPHRRHRRPLERGGHRRSPSRHRPGDRLPHRARQRHPGGDRAHVPPDDLDRGHRRGAPPGPRALGGAQPPPPRSRSTSSSSARRPTTRRWSRS